MEQLKITLSHALHDSQSSSPIVSISNSVLKKLKIPTGHPLRLRISDQDFQVICQLNHSNNDLVQVDSMIYEKVGIPAESQVYLKFDPDSQELGIGPIFAVLVSGLSKSAPPFGGLNAFCKELIHFAKNRHILAYVVTLSEIMKNNHKVNGWTYSGGAWSQQEFPYPQVIYNRIGSRKVEKTAPYIELKQRLKEQNIILFNQTFLNKWEVHSLLKESKQMAIFLPDTQLFQGPLTLKGMFDKYSVLFIKPIHGSLGKGIYRISKFNNIIRSQYTTPNGEIHTQFQRLSQLYTYLSKRINLKKYIIQQGIPILQVDGRPVDFRALMQKNISGKWAITSLVARMGPQNRFISNIARGGELSKVNTVLNKCQMPDPKGVRRRLIVIAKKACEELEAAHQGNFGELGVDLALSRSGQVYLLEINSKPSKTEETILPTLKNKGRPSVHRLLDYTLYLKNISTN